MRNRLVALLATCCAVVLVAGLMTASYQVGAGTATTPVSLGELDRARPVSDLPEDLQPVAELYDRISSGAVDAPDHDTLLRGALEGMLETLDDPYALYYDADAFSVFNQSLDGRFSGVGLLLETTPEGPTVVRALDGTPASEAGIEAGERIVSVDGRDVTDLPVSAVVDLVTGDPGTPVVLGFDGGSQGPREIELVRREIDLPTTTTELLDDGAGHISLISFTQNAAEEVRAGVEELLGQGAQGIILDLRGNPGGLLNEAVDVASVFVERELVVSVREATGDLRELRAASSGARTDVPLVVLVDRGSASASEIVAAAMQDIGRAEVVGAPTFGKGTVQTVRALSDGSGVKFTTAEYLTPSGDSIEGTGVQPDTLVDEADEQLAAAQEVLLRTVARATAGSG
jgi:carboxyl-terminal processing protease